MRPYLLRAADAYCFSPVDAERKRRAELTAKRKTPLSCGNTVGSNRKPGKRQTFSDKYNRDTYRRAIHRGCDRAGIELDNEAPHGAVVIIHIPAYTKIEKIG